MKLSGIKPTKPEIFCLHHPSNNVYQLTNKEGKLVGSMVAYPEFLNEDNIFNPNVKDAYSLYIKKLFVDKDERGKGIGKELLNIAAAESYERKCHGDVHLIAQSIENYGTPPQKFYRKNGYNSQETRHIEMIDKAIEENAKLPLNRWVTPMYREK